MANKESLIVASKVKAYIKSKKMMTSSDALGALSDLFLTGKMSYALTSFDNPCYVCCSAM